VSVFDGNAHPHYPAGTPGGKGGQFMPAAPHYGPGQEWQRTSDGPIVPGTRNHRLFSEDQWTEEWGDHEWASELVDPSDPDSPTVFKHINGEIAVMRDQPDGSVHMMAHMAPSTALHVSNMISHVGDMAGESDLSDEEPDQYGHVLSMRVGDFTVGVRPDGEMEVIDRSALFRQPEASRVWDVPSNHRNPLYRLLQQYAEWGEYPDEEDEE
jgi:hypothetical protein